MEYVITSKELKESLDELDALMGEYRTLISDLKRKHEEADKMLSELHMHLKLLKGK